MKVNSRVLLLQDIDNFTAIMMEHSIPSLVKYNLDPAEHFDHLLDWVVNQILVKFYNLNVIGHYRNDVYLCIFEEISDKIVPYFISSTNREDMAMLKGNDIKTLVNGQDLFIIRRQTYRFFI